VGVCTYREIARLGTAEESACVSVAIIFVL
jgi:hypothetical protein